MLLLALGEADLELDATAFVVKVEGNKGVAALLDLADQALDLLGVKQQLAGAPGIGDEMGRDRGQGTDVRTDEEDFGAAHGYIALRDLGPPCADRFDLPAVERKARLVALFDEIIVEGFPVLDDGHAAL